MEFLTNDKLTIVGAAGMIGSNMAQTALMMRLTPNICLLTRTLPRSKAWPRSFITARSKG